MSWELAKTEIQNVCNKRKLSFAEKNKNVFMDPEINPPIDGQQTIDKGANITQ